jgi:hypothetical protein
MGQNCHKVGTAQKEVGDETISSTTVLYCLLLVVDRLVGNDVRVMQCNSQRRDMVPVIRKKS